jgi:hypothetical protein
MLLLVSCWCRGALLDALDLARQLAPTGLQQQQQQQQGAPQATQPKKLFGAPTPEFGAMLDLPDAWWAAFPHKRRRQRQQQYPQQQQQQQYNQKL